MERSSEGSELTVHWYGEMGWGGWVAMIVAMALLWGLLIAAVVAMVRNPGSDNSHQGRADPLRVLDERFARGEIDEGEYRDRKRALSADRGPSTQPR